MHEARQVFTGYERSSSSPGAAFCESCGGSMSAVDGNGGQFCTGCGRKKYRNPLPAVSVLVARGAEVLLCRRKSESLGNGLWCLPCGYIEHNEDFLTGGIREVREETGIEVEITGILSVVTNYLSPSVHSLVVVLLAQPISQEVEPVGADDADVAEWFAADGQLPAFAFEADQHIIERFFANPFHGAPVDRRFAQLVR